MLNDFAGKDIVVVSPHSDDGVLSLGAAMSSWARRGARVKLLTVFALDPTSDRPAGGWDARAGFRTEGEAAQARREEDSKACAELGAVPVWLSYGSVDYEQNRDEAAVREVVERATEEVDALLVPGSPLSHPDHLWLARALEGGSFGCRRLGLYAEQPYTRRSKRGPKAPEWVEESVGVRLTFEPARVSRRDQFAKWRAIRQYRSQLPLLGMSRSLRRGPHSILREEMIAWVPTTGRLPQG